MLLLMYVFPMRNLNAFFDMDISQILPLLLVELACSPPTWLCSNHRFVVVHMDRPFSRYYPRLKEELAGCWKVLDCGYIPLGTMKSSWGIYVSMDYLLMRWLSISHTFRAVGVWNYAARHVNTSIDIKKESAAFTSLKLAKRECALVPDLPSIDCSTQSTSLTSNLPLIACSSSPANHQRREMSNRKAWWIGFKRKSVGK